jgi:hypothetical protein
VHAALELEIAVRLVTAHRDDGFLVAPGLVLGRRKQLDAHLAALGKARIHAQQIAGEDPGLIAARAGAQLDEDILAVVRIARQHQLLQALLQRLAPRAQHGQFFLGQRREFGIPGVGGEAFVFFDVAQQRADRAKRNDGLLDLRPLLHERGEPRLIEGRAGIGERRLDFIESLRERFEPVGVLHSGRSGASVRANEKRAALRLALGKRLPG